MNSATISALIAAAGFVLSISASAFISGAHWGELRGDVKLMSDRLAKIEGMFTLKLRDPSDKL